MKKLLSLVTLVIIFLAANAQTQPYGKVDTSDLKLTSCDFEKGANAEVLFDQASVYYKLSTVVMERHKRIKIFNDKGNDATKVRIEYYGGHKDEEISEIEAQTINLNNNNITYTPVDKAAIYTENIDKERKAIVFTFPNIKPGSIIEFTYKWLTPYPYNFPDWVFQDNIPTKYSELKARFNKDLTFNVIKKITQSQAEDSTYYTNGKNVSQGETHVWALKNIRSFKEEPFMNSITDNIQHVSFVPYNYRRSWLSITNSLMEDSDFGGQLDINYPLSSENDVLAKINSLPTERKKIEYVFDLVKNTMSCSDGYSIFAKSGIGRAWNKKKGNATELNFIIYHFLKKSGLNVSPLLVRTDGKIEEDYVTLRQFDRAVCYVTVDNNKSYYILDAANKYYAYNEIPDYALNSNQFLINTETNAASHFISTESTVPAQKFIYIDAEIAPDGEINGEAKINYFSYHRAAAAKKYSEDGEKSYADYLRSDNNSLKISALKVENLKADSLPLALHMKFQLDVTDSDGQYIYFKPKILADFSSNPFLSEERFSDIDLKFRNDYDFIAHYKIPNGFKIEALPKSLIVLMPDSSIIFKRLIVPENGGVAIQYTVKSSRSYYTYDEYHNLSTFYRKMYELLDEQIVLKKT